MKYLTGDIEYWKFHEELQSIEDEISNNPSVRENSFDFWYTSFYNTCCTNGTTDCVIERPNPETHDFPCQSGKRISNLQII
mgnify:CR=1 FL=1